MYFFTICWAQLVYSLLGLHQEQVFKPVKVTGHHYLKETFFGVGKNKGQARKNCKVWYQKCQVKKDIGMAAKILKTLQTN